MEDSSSGQPRLLRVLWVVLAVVLVLLAGLIGWQLAGGGDDDEETTEPAVAEAAPRIVDAAELRDVAAESAVPVYWAGPRAGTELELSEAGKARVYVRYLSDGAEAGDPKPAYLTVGTYALPNALAALRANAKRTNVKLLKGPRGALAWVDPDSPTSVYVARPGDQFQIEVYDPTPREALDVALSPRLRPILGG